MIQERSYNTRSRNDLKNRYSILTRRRDSLIAQGARRQANSPSTSGSSGIPTPGKGHEEDIDVGVISEDLLMQDPEAGDYAQDPAYSWSNGATTMDDTWFNLTGLGPDSSLDATDPDSAAAEMFSSADGTVTGDGENIDPLYGATASTAAQQQQLQQQLPWGDLGASEEALYGDLLDLHTPPSTEINTSDTAYNENSITQTKRMFGEDSMRRVSLVVDECDWNTLSYLLDVTEPLEGKVKLEMNF